MRRKKSHTQPPKKSSHRAQARKKLISCFFVVVVSFNVRVILYTWYDACSTWIHNNYAGTKIREELVFRVCQLHTLYYSQRKDDLKNNGCDSHSISPLFRMHEEKISLAAIIFFISLASCASFFVCWFPYRKSVKTGKKQHQPSRFSKCRKCFFFLGLRLRR